MKISQNVIELSSCFNVISSEYAPINHYWGPAAMNKRTFRYEWINISSIIHASLMMILLSLLVTWAIELLMKELIRLG